MLALQCLDATIRKTANVHTHPADLYAASTITAQVVSGFPRGNHFQKVMYGIPRAWKSYIFAWGTVSNDWLDNYDIYQIKLLSIFTHRTWRKQFDLSYWWPVHSLSRLLSSGGIYSNHREAAPTVTFAAKSKRWVEWRGNTNRLSLGRLHRRYSIYSWLTRYEQSRIAVYSRKTNYRVTSSIGKYSRTINPVPKPYREWYP